MRTFIIDMSLVVLASMCVYAATIGGLDMTEVLRWVTKVTDYLEPVFWTAVSQLS
jgi:hypothetical protein